MNKCIITLDI